jgi:hypothetical protein
LRPVVERNAHALLHYMTEIYPRLSLDRFLQCQPPE